MPTTIGETVTQLHELEERVAVKRAIASYLRTRYLSRDSTPAQSRILCKGDRVVSESVVEDEARAIEEDAADIEKSVKAKLGEVFRG